MKQVEVYTDGACSGNPGPGGWGAVLRYRFNGKVYEKELSGGDASTTNNRMELTAFIEAPVSYTHLRAHETDSYLVCRLLLEKKKKQKTTTTKKKINTNMQQKY